MSIGALESIIGPLTVSADSTATIQGSGEAYSEVGFFILVKAVTGAWTVRLQFNLNGRTFTLAEAASISAPGVVLATKASTILGKELPTPRPTSCRVFPTVPGSLSFEVFLIYT